MRQEEQQRVPHSATRKLGGACIIVGSLTVVGFRLAHGDVPAADPHAALKFISGRPLYAAVHLGTILGGLIWVGGLVALADTFTPGLGRLPGSLGAAGALVGVAVLGVDQSIDGVAGQGLAGAWAAATPARQADLELAANTAFQMLRGPSLIAILVLWGLVPMLFGRAAMLERYPAWLGWTGLAVGALTTVASVALLLREDLFPGVLLYGLLVSVVVQLWSLAFGIATWRRGTGAR